MAAKDSLITVGRQLIDKLYFSFGVEKFGSASKTLFGNNKYQDRIISFNVDTRELLNVDKENVNNVYAFSELIRADYNATIDGSTDPCHVRITIQINGEADPQYLNLIAQSPAEAKKMCAVSNACHTHSKLIALAADGISPNLKDYIAAVRNDDTFKYNCPVIRIGYAQKLDIEAEKGSSLTEKVSEQGIRRVVIAVGKLFMMRATAESDGSEFPRNVVALDNAGLSIFEDGLTFAIKFGKGQKKRICLKAESTEAREAWLVALRLSVKLDRTGLGLKPFAAELGQKVGMTIGELALAPPTPKTPKRLVRRPTESILSAEDFAAALATQHEEEEAHAAAADCPAAHDVAAVPPNPPLCAEPLAPAKTTADNASADGAHDAEYWKQKALDAEQKALALQALLEATQEPPAEAAPPAASDGKKKRLGLSLNMSPDAVSAKALERRASLKQSGEANAMLQIVTSSTSDAAVQELAEQLYRADIAAAALPQTPTVVRKQHRGADAEDGADIGAVPSDVPGKLVRMVQRSASQANLDVHEFWKRMEASKQEDL